MIMVYVCHVLLAQPPLWGQPNAFALIQCIPGNLAIFANVMQTHITTMVFALHAQWVPLQLLALKRACV